MLFLSSLGFQLVGSVSSSRMKKHKRKTGVRQLNHKGTEGSTSLYLSLSLPYLDSMLFLTCLRNSMVTIGLSPSDW